MARILLGVSGGIAAYKSLELVRLATAAGHAVRVVQTPASRRFVGAESFAALTGAPVLCSEFERDPAGGAFPDQAPPGHEPLSHLELVANADVFLIAPASANTLAKLAGGLADSLLCSCALAAGCPLVVAPAMNNRMYEHPAVQANIALLRERGAHIVQPTAGRLASRGEEGIGRLAEPADLLAACEAAVAQPAGGAPGGPANPDGRWQGIKVLVTAGGTREFPSCEVLLMAAAVSDFRPSVPHREKLKKSSRLPSALELEPTPDVLAGLAAQRRDGQTLVGFAAEHGQAALAGAREKLIAKGVDALVVNDISRQDIGFDSEQNEVTILLAAGHAPASGASATASDGRKADTVRVACAPKARVAAAVLDVVERLRRV